MDRDYTDEWNDEPLDEEQIVDEFMEGNTRARELRIMRAALEHRRDLVVKNLKQAKTEDESKTLRQKLRELDGQIAALKQEETISEFVETSVRVTLHSAPQDQ
jgi:seryl-tRNA synthetase